MSKEQTSNELSVQELLLRLQSTGARKAWTQVLDLYAPTIMMVASRYAPDPDRASDCFQHVCEKLYENDCHRLLQFNPDRGASFRTWLIAIVNNLCIDRHRTNYGRRRLPAVIEKLSKMEQLVYRYKFEQNLDLDTCLQLLPVSHPPLGRQQLSNSIARIHVLLTPRQRWSLGFRGGRNRSGEGLTGREGHQLSEIVEPGPGPDLLAQQEQERDALLRAMSRLTPQQRLLLRLHCQENMPLKDVARVAGLANLHQARRRIQAALAKLERLLSSSGFRS
jgi:RNA polymerase sigma factor (sigma-70 family)